MVRYATVMAVLDDQHDRDSREAVLASFVHDLSADDEHRLRELLSDLDQRLDTGQ